MGYRPQLPQEPGPLHEAAGTQRIERPMSERRLRRQRVTATTPTHRMGSVQTAATTLEFKDAVSMGLSPRGSILGYPPTQPLSIRPGNTPPWASFLQDCGGGVWKVFVLEAQWGIDLNCPWRIPPIHWRIELHEAAGTEPCQHCLKHHIVGTGTWRWGRSTGGVPPEPPALAR